MTFTRVTVSHVVCCIPELSNYGREPVLEVRKMHKVERMLWRFPQKRPLIGWMEAMETEALSA